MRYGDGSFRKDQRLVRIVSLRQCTVVSCNLCILSPCADGEAVRLDALSARFSLHDCWVPIDL